VKAAAVYSYRGTVLCGIAGCLAQGAASVARRKELLELAQQHDKPAGNSAASGSDHAASPSPSSVKRLEELRHELVALRTREKATGERLDSEKSSVKKEIAALSKR
jgi:hypothetical protein